MAEALKLFAHLHTVARYTKYGFMVNGEISKKYTFFPQAKAS